MEPVTLIVVTLIALIGVFITFLGLPGIFVIFLSLIIYGFYNDFSNPTLSVYISFAALALLASFTDNIGIFLGAGKYGSSKWGLLGVFVGGVLGTIFFFPVGIILGPFVGALLVELWVTKDFDKALKVAIGTFIGYISGIILKSIMALGLFTWLMFIIWR